MLSINQQPTTVIPEIQLNIEVENDGLPIPRGTLY